MHNSDSSNVHNNGNDENQTPALEQYQESNIQDTISPTTIGWIIGGLAAIGTGIAIWIKSKRKDSKPETASSPQTQQSTKNKDNGATSDTTRSVADIIYEPREINNTDFARFTVADQAGTEHEYSIRHHHSGELSDEGQPKPGSTSKHHISVHNTSHQIAGMRANTNHGNNQIAITDSNSTDPFWARKTLISLIDLHPTESISILASANNDNLIGTALELGFEWNYADKELEIMQYYNAHSGSDEFNMGEFCKTHEVSQRAIERYLQKQRLREIYESIQMQRAHGMPEAYTIEGNQVSANNANSHISSEFEELLREEGSMPLLTLSAGKFSNTRKELEAKVQLRQGEFLKVHP